MCVHSATLRSLFSELNHGGLQQQVLQVGCGYGAECMDTLACVGQGECLCLQTGMHEFHPDDLSVLSCVKTHD